MIQFLLNVVLTIKKDFLFWISQTMDQNYLINQKPINI